MIAVLDPNQKLNYIRASWGEELYTDAICHAKVIVHCETLYMVE